MLHSEVASTVLAVSFSSSKALSFLEILAAIVIGAVGLSIIGLGLGQRGGQSRKIADKLVAVVVGTTLLVGAATWATINITGYLLS